MTKSAQRKGSSGSNASIASLPRALSKLGICSRSKAVELIVKGSVKVNNTVIRSPFFRVNIKTDKISVNDTGTVQTEKIYLMLNKPRGLVTSESDEKGRETVYSCFRDDNFSHIFPVGRLDKASEGLLLFTNDTQWGNKITSPDKMIEKTYHVQINNQADDVLIKSILSGVKINQQVFTVKSIKKLSGGGKNSWIEIVLEEGKNRHIRNIFETLGIEVLRLVRVKIGCLDLGSLAKGDYRILTKEEINSLS